MYFHLPWKKCGTLLIFSSRPDARRGGITSLFKIGRSFCQLSDHHHYDHDHRHVGQQVLGANKAKDKKVVVSPKSGAETASPHGHQGVLVQGPASLDLLISLVNLVIRHSAPTLAQPWFLFWS